MEKVSLLRAQIDNVTVDSLRISLRLATRAHQRIGTRLRRPQTSWSRLIIDFVLQPTHELADDVASRTRDAGAALGRHAVQSLELLNAQAD